MSVYVCPNCKKEVTSLPEGKVRCPHCGFRLLFKKRPPVVKTITAR